LFGRNVQVVLIESHRRKAAFLKEASRDLANVRVLAKRAEDVAERFDWVVSRAVRYSDIAGALKKLGRNAELLTGELRAADLPGFEWQNRSSFLGANGGTCGLEAIMFHVKQSLPTVSRETGASDQA
jgi:hypothetical protein